MSSHLSEIINWSAFARTARYKCENLAGECLVSERQLERFFLAQFKETPKQWMQSLRMRLARDMIQCGYSTKAVAGELCYQGSCQFCREFKRYFGRSPQFYTPGPNVGFRQQSRILHINPI